MWGPDQGRDGLHIFLLHAGCLQDLPSQLGQGMNRQIALIGQADEAILVIVRLGLGLEGCEPDFADSGSFVGCQLVLSAGLESGQDKELELFFGGDENTVGQTGWIGSTWAGQITALGNGNTVGI